jgi:preprotein translocase subunit SecE
MAVIQSNDGKRAGDEDVREMVEGDDAGETKPAAETPRSEPLPYRGPTAKATAAEPGFFTIYKKGQGYWTRMGTAIGAAGLGLMVAYVLYDKIPTFMTQDTEAHQRLSHRVALIVSLVFLVTYTSLAWWFTNKASNVDFLIATDSEMKKVNWTTRKELIGSTKIVILFMFIIALFLFGCDLLFGAFFHLIGVLKTWF